MEWRNHARCCDMDSSVFFPEHAEDDPYAVARSVCQRCCVRERCLQWALEHAETEHGMWGGLTPRERRRERRRAGLTGRPLQPHGTRAAWVRHREAGEEPCEDCQAANVAYHRDRYVKRSKAWAS